MVPPIPTPAPPVQAPVADLLGDDVFTPYVQAPSTQSPIDDDEFGQFHEASTVPTKQPTIPTSM
jgi:hypothetical protein